MKLFYSVLKDKFVGLRIVGKSFVHLQFIFHRSCIVQRACLVHLRDSCSVYYLSRSFLSLHLVLPHICFRSFFHWATCTASRWPPVLYHLAESLAISFHSRSVLRRCLSPSNDRPLLILCLDILSLPRSVLCVDSLLSLLGKCLHK